MATSGTTGAASSGTRRPWPLRLRFCAGARELVMELDDGEVCRIPYRRLREQSPSAEVRGHGAGPPRPQPPVPADIGVTGAERVGRYAVRILFSDGHTTGLYTWPYLQSLAGLSPE